MEVWKPVVGYELTHLVSNMGRVRRLRHKVLASNGQSRTIRGKMLVATTVDSDGYPQVSIKGRLHFIHKLVAEAFIGPRPHGMEICHNDGKRKNAKAVNLRYDTKKNNQADKVLHGTALRGSTMPAAKLTEKSALEIYNRAKAGEKVVDLAKEFGVCSSTISVMLSGKTWTHVTGGSLDRSETNPRSTISVDTARAIKQRIKLGDSNASLAREFDIDPSTVSRIKSGATWGWLNV